MARALTARHSHRSVHALPLDLQVPRNEHLNWEHRLYWRGIVRPNFRQYFDCLDMDICKRICLRRWNDFKGLWTPSITPYVGFEPPAIKGGLGYHWELQDEDGTSVCSFTNIAEAWFLVNAGHVLQNERYFLRYFDHG